MAHIALKNIVKLYDDKHPVIHGIDLDIRDGEFVVFVGPSGCGKSTLLRMIAGLEDITDGELHIGGQLANDIAPAERGLAMVFQSYALYPHMTVYENMAFALFLAGHKKAEVRAAVERAADILQITPLLKRKPKDLSGGQRQRVAIGRAIVRKPKVFLFDEPLSNLDASLRVQMRVEISRLHQELKTTMIYVTHDQVEAMTLGERIVVFNGGRIEQVGSPHELYNNPGNLFVAGFLGAPKMNFIACEAVACGPGSVAVRLPGGAMIDIEAQGDAVAPGNQLTLGVRAEHVSLQDGATANNNVVDATVSHVEYLGDVAIVYASMRGVTEMLAVKLPAEEGLRQAGDAMRLHLPPQRCLLFDAKGQALARTFGAPAQPFM
ncbi:sn-glycerol-3-phosphate ABC transporter ATP-binding protein UgpC [Janthinobacterium agaricidamnosum]|uniref:sn-glycerol-3-phosphate ABC transporter ATP-binding protein UgpC n=1 Tax=Janthinobacterium agaricidamnosum TaxID=55508 RepID=A0A3G2E6K5_9BURK|nr:sn-glycerol-3-phosphate ABC transporter ATP-binding protein UgpC [Janthinobacterium agaricidamnosum]AYM75089.1 sn-glycerol-3-phosphate ABC transporter ATP-binding protein UgpC [Janthinobacterium agaricidamnosum]